MDGMARGISIGFEVWQIRPDKARPASGWIGDHRSVLKEYGRIPKPLGTSIMQIASKMKREDSSIEYSNL